MSAFIHEMEKLCAQLEQLRESDRQTSTVKRNHHLPSPDFSSGLWLWVCASAERPF